MRACATDVQLAPVRLEKQDETGERRLWNDLMNICNWSADNVTASHMSEIMHEASVDIGSFAVDTKECDSGREQL